jgi:galactose mutarotase-like enzyme
MEDVILTAGQYAARIAAANQQLTNLQYAHFELLHGGGRPFAEQTPAEQSGWQNTEIIMFPIVGPAQHAQLTIEGSPYAMGQHGIIRHLPFTLREKSETHAIYTLTYTGAPVHDTLKGATYRWPYSFRMEKQYALTQFGLTFTCTIENTSSHAFRYALGWHPAFHTAPQSTIEANGVSHTLEEIKTASQQGALLLNEGVVIYRTHRHELRFAADYGKYMVWSPAAPLLCIEPVTRHAQFNGLSSLESYDVLQPGETKTYTAILSVRTI